MRKVGVTNDSNILIELSKEEYRALIELADAASGEVQDFMNFRHDWSVKEGSVFNYTGLFGAILAFTHANYRLNELQNLINRARLDLFDENSNTE